jgi:hypothetical protein
MATARGKKHKKIPKPRTQKIRREEKESETKAQRSTNATKTLS